MSASYGRQRRPGPIDPNALSAVEPPDLGWVAAYWADDVPGAVNDPVDTWDDRSGNNRDLTQASSSLRPTVTTRAALNNKRAVLFDGSDDLLQCSSWAGVSQPVSYVVVLDLITVASGSRFIADRVSATAELSESMALYWNGSSSWSLFAGSSEMIVSTVLPSTGNKGLVARFNGASSNLSVNGTSMSTADNVGSNQSDGLTVGARRDGTGHANIAVGFFGVYAGNVTDAAQWAAFQSFVSSFYDVTI